MEKSKFHGKAQEKEEVWEFTCLTEISACVMLIEFYRRKGTRAFVKKNPSTSRQEEKFFSCVARFNKRLSFHLNNFAGG